MEFIQVSPTHIIWSRLLLCGQLDGVGHKAEDGTDPQQDGEATSQLAAEFDPFRSPRGWSKGIGATPGQVLCCFGIGQTLWGKASKERWSWKVNKKIVLLKVYILPGKHQCCISGKSPPETFCDPSTKKKNEIRNSITCWPISQIIYP